MMIIATIVAVVAIVLACALEMADGALLVAHTAREHAADADAVRNERERTHRALSMAKVVTYLAAGAAVATAGRLATFASAPRVLLEIAIAVLVVVVAESAGRTIAQARPQATLARLQAIVQGAVTLLAPAVALGALLEHGLNAALPPTAPDDEDRETTEEQFREVVAAESEISTAEQALIHGVFSMGDTEVRDIMVPRVDIVGIERETPWSEVLDRVRSFEHSRVPVYEETLDNITGVLYAKDLLLDVLAGENRLGEWQRLVRRAGIIPTSKQIDAQLREFQASHTHIAIVVDEYGGTAGLVTIEDILEEIVGEIHDEYDVAEPEIRREGTGRYWVAGGVALDELEELLRVNFDVQDVTTVGGLVYELFGRVPRGGDAITRNGYRIVVEGVRRRRIERVYFERLDGVPAEEVE